MSATIPADLDLQTPTTFTKTISESDVYGFAGITGDFSPNHVNAQAMAATRYGARIAHGVLVLGLASTASSHFVADRGLSAVSYGYDRVRFIKPVYFGDTVTMHYQLTHTDQERNETRASVTGTNQKGEIVLTCQHILRFVQ
jgi:acyl dehydratase